MKKRILILLSMSVLSLVVLLSATFDDDFLNTLLARLERLRTEFPQEKVHLHFDKSYYSLGDDIWFKAYVVNAENNELSALSKVLYIDFVDGKDSVRKTIVLPIVNGLCYGDLKLTDSLFDAGNYQVVAYTRWMQNFDHNYFFKKSIPIGDALSPAALTADAKFTTADKLNAVITYRQLTDKAPLTGKPVNYTLVYNNKILTTGKTQTDGEGKIALKLPYKEDYNIRSLYLQTIVNPATSNSIIHNFQVNNSSQKIDLQFFPEGGQLVNGLRSKIGFKAIGPTGRGMDCTGSIVDQSNQTITQFKSEHAGMGMFAFQPIAGNKYTAIVKDASGENKRYPLPDALPEGYVLGVNHLSNDSISIKIAASAALTQGKEVVLIAQQNGTVKYTARVKMTHPLISTVLDKARFSTGMVQFTLFKADYTPLAERLLFVNHQDALNVKVSVNKPSFGKRERVEMQLAVTDKAGAPVTGSFSVAVTDADKVKQDEDTETTILSNLLLSSDLRGYIENPNYYFRTINEERIRHLDELLLTQGWRRFTWTDLKNDKFPEVKYEPQDNLEVSGKIVSLTDKGVPNGKVTLYATTAEGPIILDTTADDNGRFIFKNLMFTGDVKFVIRAKNAKDKDNVKIILDQPAILKYDYLTLTRNVALNNYLIEYLQSTQKRFDELSKNGLMDKSIMLKQVNIKEKKILKTSTIPNSTLIGGTPDIVLKKDKFEGHMSLIQAFYGLPGIEVKNDMVYRVGRVNSITRPGGVPMLIILNGSPIDPDMVKEIPPTSVEGIEILKSGQNTTVYGQAGAWGVIIITSKFGGTDGGALPATYLGRTTVKGYALQREFYSPAYDKPADNHKAADLRSTIYWKPDVITDENGQSKLTFYTADDTGTYNVVVEGLNIEGKLARQTYTFTVK